MGTIPEIVAATAFGESLLATADADAAKTLLEVTEGGGGDHPFGTPWTTDPRDYHAVTTIPDGANRAVYVRVPWSGTITKLAIIVGTASGNISLGVYANSGLGSSAAPAARKGTTGAVACPAAGFREVALGGSVAVVAGDWFALSADNTTATFYRALGAGGPFLPWLCGKQASAHPVPSPAGAITADDRPFIIVGIP